MSTVVPLSTTLRTEILPPCASTIAFATAQADTICLQITVTFERFKQGRYRFGRNPSTGIGNSQHYLLVDGIDGKREGATPYHRVHRILDHVAKCADKPSEVDVDVALVANMFDEFDVFAREEMKRLAIHFVEQAPD